jgi:hypothetical protein
MLPFRVSPVRLRVARDTPTVAALGHRGRWGGGGDEPRELLNRAYRRGSGNELPSTSHRSASSCWEPMLARSLSPQPLVDLDLFRPVRPQQVAARRGDAEQPTRSWRGRSPSPKGGASREVSGTAETTENAHGSPDASTTATAPHDPSSMNSTSGCSASMTAPRELEQGQDERVEPPGHGIHVGEETHHLHSPCSGQVREWTRLSATARQGMLTRNRTTDTTSVCGTGSSTQGVKVPSPSPTRQRLPGRDHT